jgi:hypothetical protein
MHPSCNTILAILLIIQEAFMLEYFLELNMLTSDNPDDMRAQTANVVSHNHADIIDRIMKSGASLNRSDIVSVLEAEKGVIYDILSEGGAAIVTQFTGSAKPSKSLHTALFDIPRTVPAEGGQ